MDSDCVRVSVAGDGVVVARRRDGDGYTLITSDYPSGAPFYLNYGVNATRYARYIQEFGTVQHVLTRTNVGEIGESRQLSVVQADGNVPLTFDFPISLYDYVFVMSDGAQSFSRPLGVNGAREAVPVQEIAEAMLAVKSFEGQFLVRRAKKFLKDVEKQGWRHDDDFSVAGLHLGSYVETC